MAINLPDNYIALEPEAEHFLSSAISLYIDGEYVTPVSGQYFETLDPSSGRVLASVGRGQAADVDLAVKAARKAFDSGPWQNKMSPSDRAKCIWRLAELIEQNGAVLAQLDSLDNGKPFETTHKVDIPLSAEHLYYYAGWCSKIEGSTIPLNERDMFN
jgi:acyl-CoA reductase-like NAD-dependent aldehyde dehydrogenase